MRLGLSTLLLGLLLAVPVRAQRAALESEPGPFVRPAPVDVGWSDNAISATLPPNFVDDTLPSNWQQAVGLTFAADGRMFVWEKRGRVWPVINDMKAAQPLIAIQDEVGNWGDHGMLGFALDPDFLNNGFIYLMYVVDYHHLVNFGTPAYDSGVDEYFRDTIARITRYTANAATGFTSIVPGSRQVLLGEDITTGIPVCGSSHSMGSLTFATDGSLMVSVADGATLSLSNTCLTDGIITPAEDVGPFRAQLLNSLSGKILRLNPSNGDAQRTNPWYDNLNPRSAESRVWALGVRNPFRMLLRPGTGSTNVLDADPGTLFVGDVGDGRWEELSTVRSPGANLGWPLYEGFEPNVDYATDQRENLDAPNPLFDGSGCPKEFFYFQDLIVEDTLNVPSWPNPCDPGQQVPASLPRFEHQRPALAWGHGAVGAGGAEVPVYDGFGEAASLPIDDPGSPVAGDSFVGRCAVAGSWYAGGAFPAPYLSGLFVADFNTGWIRFLTFDVNDQLLAVEPFSPFAGSVVDMDANPIDGSLYYINYNDLGAAKLHKITYNPNNLAPIAVATAEPSFGPSPLAVQFDALASFDPDGGPVTYSWDFGPGLPQSVQSMPVFTFPATDVTDGPTIISRTDSMDPPAPMGIGSFPDVIRDLEYGPAGSLNFSLQYDTVHYDEFGVPDKQGEDWLGYSFTGSKTFTGLVYQEGVNLESGGWFAELHIQVRSGGRWTDVTGLQIEPSYPGDVAIGFERWEIRFDPTPGDGIRLYGVPGGSFEYISAAELRVITTPTTAGPSSVNVTVTVTDDQGAVAEADLQVSLNNTPPLIEILQPGEGTPYPIGPSTPVNLIAAVTDAEHGPGELSYEWQVVLHHNEHVHFGPVLTDVSPETSLSSDGCDGDIHFLDVRLTVTDADGLSTTAIHYLPPICDCNLNGEDDAVDIANNPSLDGNGDGRPDLCDLDCNSNGLPDVFEIFLGRLRDSNHNGIPDGCEPSGNPLPDWGGQGPPPPPLPGSSSAGP